MFTERFKDKVMVVTGGTSGIGKAVCIRAGAEGATVVNAGRNEERGKAIEQTMGITAVSGAIFLLLCDTLARTLMTIEIPISILTSLFGALALVVLFVKGRLHL